MTVPSLAKYNGVAMILHWVTAVLMIFMITVGEELIGNEGEAGGFISATFLPSVHVSIGVAIVP